MRAAAGDGRGFGGKDDGGSVSEKIDYQWQTYSDGDAVECWDCSEQASGIFYGYCPRCWANLPPQKRAIFKGEEPPVEKVIREVVHHRDEVVTYKNVVNVQNLVPPRPLLTATRWIWAAAITVATAWLVWRAR